MSAPATLDVTLRRDLGALGARSRVVRANGLELHVLSYGSAGPQVLVLPGITSPAITWDFVARELADAAQLHVLDLRGRGLSAHRARSYTLADYAADAIALVHALGLERPLLLGHSLGARIAAAAAALRPGLAGGLILVDPPLSGPGRGPYPTSLDAFLAQLREAQRGTTAEEVRRHYPHWPQAELELRARWLPTCEEVAVVATHRGFETDDFFDLWPLLAPPLALVHGAESPVVTGAGARELAAANRAAELVPIAGAGHMVPWDSLEPFLAAVRRLLTRFRPSSTSATARDHAAASPA